MKDDLDDAFPSLVIDREDRRAMSLNNQSDRLADLGRREEALAAIEEAVTIRRELAAARPDAFLPDLAMSLNNQSSRLSELGRREDALAAIEEAVTIRRELAARPARRVPARPRHVAEQPVAPPGGAGAAGGGPGRDRGGRHHLPRAGRARPDAFLPDLATSLNNQSNRLSELGRREEALAAIEEAVTIRRELAAAQPRRVPARPRHVAEQPVQPPVRAGAAGGGPGRDRGGRHHPPRAGRGPPRRVPARPRHVAEQPVRPAWRTWGGGRRPWPRSRRPSPSTAQLAAARPDAFLPDLAMSLNNQSVCLADLGRREEALAADRGSRHHPPRAGRGPPRRVPARPGHVAEQPVDPPGRAGAAGGGAGRHRGGRHHPPRAGRGPPRRVPARPRHVAEQPVDPPGRPGAAGGGPGRHRGGRHHLPPAGRGPPRRVPARPGHGR